MALTRFFRKERQPGLNAPADRILVIGVGGAGGNAVRSMAGDMVGVDLVAADTDAQALGRSCGVHRLQLASGNGQAAAQAAGQELDLLLTGVRVCFVAAGMGGRTGGSAAPAIAEQARARGILTIGLATLPFAFEGDLKRKRAERDLLALRRATDTVITITNERLLNLSAPDAHLASAFRQVDSAIEDAVHSVADLLVRPGTVNLGFADLAAVIRGMGSAVIGKGEANGPRRASLAAERASANPLLAHHLDGSRRALVSVTGGEDLLLSDLEQAVGAVAARMPADAELLWGSASDPALTGRVRVSIVATAGTKAPAAPRTACAGQHVPHPDVVFNQGFFFATCRYCDREILRSGRTWKLVPRGFRVVWRPLRGCSPLLTASGHGRAALL